MSQASLIAAAKAAAEAHKLVLELVCAVVEQESGWNTWLIRYEPTFEASPRYGATVRGQAHDFAATSETKYGYETTWETEVKARCTSWGLMQVMGQVAREQGFKGPLPMLCDIANGLEVSCTVLAAHIERFPGDVQAGLESYNGGADPGYAAKVMSRAPKYR